MKREVPAARRLIESLVEFAQMRYGTRGKPGEIVQMLPEEKRNILKTLKESDVQNVRWPNWS